MEETAVFKKFFKFRMKSLACQIIPGMPEAGSGRDMTSAKEWCRPQSPWEFGEPGLL